MPSLDGIENMLNDLNEFKIFRLQITGRVFVLLCVATALCTAILLLILFRYHISSSLGSSYGKLVAETLKVDLGLFRSGESRTVPFQFRNAGAAPVDIVDVLSDCGCTTIKFVPSRILPGTTIDGQINFNSTGLNGHVTRKIRVITSGNEQQVINIEVQATVQQSIKVDRRAASFAFSTSTVYPEAAVFLIRDRGANVDMIGIDGDIDTIRCKEYDWTVKGDFETRQLVFQYLGIADGIKGASFKVVIIASDGTRLPIEVNYEAAKEIVAEPPRILLQNSLRQKADLHLKGTEGSIISLQSIRSFFGNTVVEKVDATNEWVDVSLSGRLGDVLPIDFLIVEITRRNGSCGIVAIPITLQAD